MALWGTPGERIGYELHDGPAGAPLIACVHGITASRASFSANLAGLTKHFRVLLIELLGHGESDAPEDVARYAPGPAIDRIAGLFADVAQEPILLCGHSLGGAVTLRFALDRPEMLAGLVVINSNSAAGTPEWRQRASEGMARMASRLRTEGPGFIKETSLYPATTRVPEPARSLIAADFERLTGTGVAATMEALTVPVNAWERLGELSVPTLLTVGTRDRQFAAALPGMLDRLPTEPVRVVTLEGAGHAANLEQPDAFNDAVVTFAQEIAYLAP